VHSEANDLFPQYFYAELDPMSFPVFLQLREILHALFRHLLLVHFVFIIARCASHLHGSVESTVYVLPRGIANLERIEIPQSLYRCNQFGEIVYRRYRLIEKVNVCSEIRENGNTCSQVSKSLTGKKWDLTPLGRSIWSTQSSSTSMFIPI